jgi:Glucosidase II beta subunit-like protein
MTARMKSTRCTRIRSTFVFALLLSLGVVQQSETAAAAADDGNTAAAAAESIYAQLYPPHEEYDYAVLDPYHAYGSPYGGFSRATRTRLASLPLFLPETSEVEPRQDALHTTLRDAEGRLFACRVYHEDELDPSSIGESMFEPPRFRSDITNDAAATAATALENKDSGVDGSSDDTSTATPAVDDKDKNALPAPLTSPREIISSINLAMLGLNVEERLGQLHGLCGQVHKGWWSYEWCYKKEVTQFHVHVYNERDFEVKDITSLGTYFERKIHLDLTDIEKNEMAEDIPEIARVVDYHSDGEYCEATDQPRVTYVKLQCCSSSHMQESKGVVHRDSIPLASDLLSLHDFMEDPDRVCTYNATVCTPLLCLDDGPDGESLLQLMNQSSKNKDRHLAASDNETILEILHRTLDGLCLQSVTGGWWTYEFCHGKGIRQYHEVVGTKKTSTGSSFTAKVTETEHQLGRFQPESIQNIMNEAEWKLVVNATDKKGGIAQSYFELEYQDGDVCDHADVTESAIIAGAVGGAKSGGLARSSSVRYYCGDKYDVSVSEDSTCHYLVKVNVPDLCRHALFAAPVSKKQIVKCLQADEFL